MSFSSIFGAIFIPVSTLLGTVAFREGAEPMKLPAKTLKKVAFDARQLLSDFQELMARNLSN